MTATAPPPVVSPDEGTATGSTPPGATTRRPRRTRHDPSIPAGHLLLAELALGALTCAAVFGFIRIFDSWSFLAPLLVVAVAGHATSAWCRRRGIGLPGAFVISAIEWFLVVTWLFFVDTTLALVPTPDTFSTARLELDRSWTAFQEIVAPAPVQTGFLLAAALAVAGAAFLADWAAFRLWSAREALVPAITLFVFATLLSDDRDRVMSAVVMVAAAIGFVLVHRVVSLERSEGWVTSGRAAAGRSLLLAGTALAVVAVAVGTLVAPLLPGVDEDPLIDWRNQNGTDNARMLTSPLVDIRARLVDTSTTPLFTVEADTPAYWRMAALDVFDGTQWRLAASTDQIARGFLEVDRRAVDQGTELVQRFTIQDLETYWWPAAFQPVQLDPGDDELVRYDIETATLIGDTPTGEGTTYDVLSRTPDHTPDQLRSADQGVPGAIEGALALPDDFSPTAARLAREATAGAASHYDQALALQEFFRGEEGGFTYSTDITGGQSNDAIEAFLESRVGYCEQFAGTYAAMARSLGIPARVAVGYTWGDQDPATGTFQVLGRNAHAWPEVYLGQYGWVPFEPTPGRGNPSAESYTGVDGAQESEVAVATTTTTTAVADGASTTTTAPAGTESAAAAADSGNDAFGDLVRGVVQVAVLAVAAMAFYALAVPGSLALRRRRRRAHAAGSPAARIGVAWTEATESLAATGVRARRDETHTELAARARATLPATGAPMDRLSATADAAAYGPSPTATDGETAEQAAAEVDAVVEASLGRAGRLRRRLDPRPLWEGRARRHRTR